MLKLKNNSGRLNHQIVRQFEANDRLSRNIDVTIPRQAAQRRPSACANQAANKQPNAAGGHAANQHSKSGASANKRR
jgi:hypothetical protein